MESHRDNTNGLVNRRASQHLCDFDREDVRSVHHRGQVAMNLLLDEFLQTGNEVDVETKAITTKGLADVVDGRSLQEAHFNTVDVRERNLQLDLEAHDAREGHIFDNNVETLADHGFSDSDLEHDLWVDFVFLLANSHISGIVGGEAKFPVHHDDVVLGLGISLDMLHTRRLTAQSKSLELETVEERRSGRA
ncbi:hypothetical protein HG530_002975 [Fusarium avenaceum]|nr:hypothetical protein HG530_002975 [Fusarium avenaceum]